MIISQSIFTRASLQPLLNIWAQLERSVNAAYPQPRAHDVRGDFAAISDAWSALAQKNSDILDALGKTKAQRKAHEDLCAKCVHEKYNDFLAHYNAQRRTNAIALGGLSTTAVENIAPAPREPSSNDDPIVYALELAQFHRQYWSSASAFLDYAREVLNLREQTKTLSRVAQAIHDQYFTPLNTMANVQWLELLVIGGTAAALQVAREYLTAPYTSGSYPCRTFIANSMNRETQTAVAIKLKQAFVRAVSHPRSNPDTDVSYSRVDLGL